MFRRILGIGLIAFLLISLFGGLSQARSQAAFNQGYQAGLQAQTLTTTSGEETAVPTAPVYHRYEPGYGRFPGWGLVGFGLLGLVAFFFKIGFFLFLLMLISRLFFGHRRGYGHHWRHYGRCHHGGEHAFHSKRPKWMNEAGDEEIIKNV